MGKTPKPLLIVVIGDIGDWDELQKLVDQGHTIWHVTDDDDTMDGKTLLAADVILGTNCWRMAPALRDYLPLAIKEARMLKYPNEERHSKTKRRAVAHSIDPANTDEPLQSDEG